MVQMGLKEDFFGSLLSIKIKKNENFIDKLKNKLYNTTIIVASYNFRRIFMNQQRDTLTLLFELSKLTRCCQEGSVICQKLTFYQFYVLDLIDRKGILEMSDLHDLLYIEKSTTTRLIEPLVQEGLITKEKAVEDKRTIHLSLTELGKKTCQQTWLCVSTYIDQIDTHIPNEKKNEVYAALHLFLDALKNAHRT